MLAALNSVRWFARDDLGHSAYAAVKQRMWLYQWPFRPTKNRRPWFIFCRQKLLKEFNSHMIMCSIWGQCITSTEGIDKQYLWKARLVYLIQNNRDTRPRQPVMTYRNMRELWFSRKKTCNQWWHTGTWQSYDSQGKRSAVHVTKRNEATGGLSEVHDSALHYTATHFGGKSWCFESPDFAPSHFHLGLSYTYVVHLRVMTG
jgi:hypothetical protein